MRIISARGGGNSDSWGFRSGRSTHHRRPAVLFTVMESRLARGRSANGRIRLPQIWAADDWKKERDAHHIADSSSRWLVMRANVYADYA